MAGLYSPEAVLRPDLGTAVEDFDIEMNRKGFIGSRIYPIRSVAEQAGKYPRIEAGQLMRRVDVKRGNKSGYGQDDFEFKMDSYSTDEYGLEGVVDDRESKMYRHMFDYEQTVTRRTQNLVMQEAEHRYADHLFNTTTFGAGQQSAIGTQWSTPASATPVTDVKTAKIKVRDRCGIVPDTLAITWKIWENLLLNAEIVDKSKAQGFVDVRPGALNLQAVMTALNIPKLLVAGGVFNSANEGQAASFGSIWDDDMALLCKTPDTDDMREVCLGRTLHWSEDGSNVDDDDPGVVGTTVEAYRDEPKRADKLRARHDVSELDILLSCGELLTGVDS